MNKKIIFTLIYISLLILIWGTIGSIIDYPLLQLGVYNAGAFGQYITFIIIGGESTIAGLKLYKKVQNKFIEWI